jgi:hypothetical protein
VFYEPRASLAGHTKLDTFLGVLIVLRLWIDNALLMRRKLGSTKVRKVTEIGFSPGLPSF